MACRQGQRVNFSRTELQRSSDALITSILKPRLMGRRCPYQVRRACVRGLARNVTQHEQYEASTNEADMEHTSEVRISRNAAHKLIHGAAMAKKSIIALYRYPDPASIRPVTEVDEALNEFNHALHGTATR